ncbi:fluoride efflux transporter CrcB [Actinomycetospora corticicola]|uniref:Fluoride-specific ion channel FluC n=1 Tax=Actinomycetospora corticicola TaxID=663602 RepID=A0A7Y9DYX5_9PSEU|nr:CrcB family protein [Actinomycetospora corticicola]NYD37921.1 CrcB protein [Actinomycetospora corticicola]
MTAVAGLWVALGAAIGAPTRYLVDRALQRTHGTSFPWGTFTVNVAASLVLGVVLGGAAPSAVVSAVGTGFCGGLSTWSTLGYETVRLAEAGERTHSVLNVLMSTFAGLGAASLGLLIGAGAFGP